MSIVHVSFDKVKETTLLTKEQVERLPLELLACGRWWWLRSPGSYQYDAAIVRSDGSVNHYGNYVNYDDVCVRPAFVIPGLDSKIYDKVQLGGYRYTLNGDYIGGCVCTVVDKDLLLADDVVCRHHFDAESNNWDKSELKAFIEGDGFKSLIMRGSKVV